MVRKIDPKGKAEAILTAAIAEFAAKGFHGANAADIAKMAEVSVGTIYRIFESKEKLANKAYQRCYERYTQLRSDALLSPKLSPRKQFGAIWSTLTSLYGQYPQEFIFAELHFHAGFLDETSKMVRTQVTNRMMQWIETMKAEKVLRDLPYDILQANVAGSLTRLIKTSLDEGFSITQKMLDQCEELCWHAVALDP